MPGIAGVIGTGSPEQDSAALRKMVKCMMHEQFYASGTYINEQLGLWVGWVSHEGSFSDWMPLWNEKKDVCIIFSGEDFTNPPEIERLRSRGHDSDSENASYLVHLYEEMGPKFIEKLNGWFCGLIVDHPGKKVILFNDRYGMHRVFVHENKNGFYFASEAKVLLTVLPEARKFDLKGLGEFLTCGCTLGNKSLFRNVSILPPASLWVFENGECEKKSCYFTPQEWVGQSRLDEKQIPYSLIEPFGDFFKRYTGGPLPVGVSLTGGLDSRMIMACLETRDSKFPCYTFGSMYRDTFDVKIAKEVAKACGQPYRDLVLGEDFLRDFPKYLEKAVYISDGYLGMSGAAELYVNSLARDIAPVRLTGNYGGELLRGVRAFKYEFPKATFVNPDILLYLKEAQTTFQRIETNDALSFALFHQAPSQGYGRMAVERSQVILRTPFMDNDLVKLVYQAPSKLLKGEQLSFAIISRYNPNLLNIPTDRGLLCNGSQPKSLTRQLYRKGLIKAEYWSGHGMPNWLTAISRYGLDRFIEKRFIGRDKFQHFRLWTQKHFATYIADVLIAGSREMGEFFNLRQVESIVHEHVAGKKNYIDEIDKILTLILMSRTLFKGGVSRT